MHNLRSKTPSNNSPDPTELQSYAFDEHRSRDTSRNLKQLYCYFNIIPQCNPTRQMSPVHRADLESVTTARQEHLQMQLYKPQINNVTWDLEKLSGLKKRSEWKHFAASCVTARPFLMWFLCFASFSLALIPLFLHCYCSDVTINHGSASSCMTTTPSRLTVTGFQKKKKSVRNRFYSFYFHSVPAGLLMR